ncbi:unnamed protein product, partial [Oppiella nova]
MLSKHVLNCSFSQWYPLFANISIDSKIVRLSDDFIQYLLSDGIILPKSGPTAGDNTGSDWSSDEENGPQNGSNSLSGDDDSDSDDNVPDIEFNELDVRLREALQEFGSVFPKLNWSSCEDSRWISASGTRCTTTEDIYLLLKSSDRVVHD